MPVPGPITLNSLTPGVASLFASWTQSTPADTDSIYVQVRQTGQTAWITGIVFDETGRDIWNLNGSTSYDVRVRGYSNADGFGPWSNTLTQTTLADSFSNAPVIYDEDGVQPGPIVENNNGSAGANYDMNTVIGDPSQLSNQVRNGRNVWQTTGAGALRVPVVPPTPAIAQPFTVYFALTPFFLDGNFRYVLRGQDNRFQLAVRQDGFILASNFNGIYGVGNPPSTDGRLYVVEAVVNNTGSSLRVLDDVGNDTGIVTGNINFSGNVQPSSYGGGPAGNTNEYLPAQYMELAIYSGVGSAAEREARIEELFQKWSAGAPDIIEYRTATAAPPPLLAPNSDMDGMQIEQDTGRVITSLAPPAAAMTGTTEVIATMATALAPPSMVGRGGGTINGEVVTTLANPLMVGQATYDPPPPLTVSPFPAPDFERVFQHLLPQGQTFKL